MKVKTVDIRILRELACNIMSWEASWKPTA